MTQAIARPRAVPPRAGHAGALLREWRAARRFSQLDLALDAGVSVRHLSYVETGKAQPSRAMLLRLAEVLDMPPRERNTLLVAAGYAREFAETELDAQQARGIERAIDYLLRQQEPYPAFLVGRHWEKLAANRGAERVDRFVMGGRPSAHSNIVRQVFDPADMRAAIANWDELACDLIRHVHAAIALTPSDAVARGLLEEALAYPGVPASWRMRDLDAAPAPLLTTVFRRDGRELRFFSTVTTFGVEGRLAQEARHIKSCFPMDEATAAFCRRLRDDEDPVAS